MVFRSGIRAFVPNDPTQVVLRYVDNPNGSVDEIGRTDERDASINRRGGIEFTVFASSDQRDTVSSPGQLTRQFGADAG